MKHSSVFTTSRRFPLSALLLGGFLILGWLLISNQSKPISVLSAPATDVARHPSEAQPSERDRAWLSSLSGAHEEPFQTPGAIAHLEHHTNIAGLAPTRFFLPTCTPPTGLIISEFRWRGPGGVNDEFVELYNNNDATLTICTADGSSGWAVASADGVVRFVIPGDTTIPGRGHLLATGSSYSLSSYAASDLPYTSGIPHNMGIALFNTANPANFSTAARLDAVGFTSDASLYREGTGLAALSIGNVEYTLRRNLAAGTPADTNNNSADFEFLATDGSSGSKLGAPGPENLTSPIQRNAHMPIGAARRHGGRVAATQPHPRSDQRPGE